MLTINKCMLYPNARIRQNGNIFQFVNVVAFILWIGEDLSRNVNESLTDCKFQLKPLSKLTEEEKKYIETEFGYDLENCHWDISIEHIENLLLAIDFDKIIQCIDQLRLWNYDIDGMEKEGDAVYE